MKDFAKKHPINKSKAKRVKTSLRAKRELNQPLKIKHLFIIAVMSALLLFTSNVILQTDVVIMIGAWPIAMGVSMFIQQKLNPAPTDPMQAKIFMFFPLFLTIILAPFPAGLVIYWTVNNILTMAQQVFIMKRTTVKTVT